MVGKLSPPAGRNAGGVAAARLPRQRAPRSRPFRSCSGLRRSRFTRLCGRQSPQELVERLAGAYRVRPRPRSGGRLFADPGATTRRRRTSALADCSLAHTPSEKQEEAVFDIVNQLNRGAALVTSRDEREQIAELNLIAGRRREGARRAYISALNYLAAGSALLPADCLGAPASARLFAGAAQGRMRIRDRRRSGRGAAPVCSGRTRRGCAVSRMPWSRACGWTCIWHSVSATAAVSCRSRLPATARY